MNDEEAVRRCQDGDREAFRHLVDRYKDLLYGTACLMTGNTSIAEEHVQEAFISAWRGMSSFRIWRGPDRFRQVAVNLGSVDVECGCELDSRDSVAGAHDVRQSGNSP